MIMMKFTDAKRKPHRFMAGSGDGSIGNSGGLTWGSLITAPEKKTRSPSVATSRQTGHRPHNFSGKRFAGGMQIAHAHRCPQGKHKISAGLKRHITQVIAAIPLSAHKPFSASVSSKTQSGLRCVFVPIGLGQAGDGSYVCNACRHLFLHGMRARPSSQSPLLLLLLSRRLRNNYVGTGSILVSYEQVCESVLARRALPPEYSRTTRLRFGA